MNVLQFQKFVGKLSVPRFFSISFNSKTFKATNLLIRNSKKIEKSCNTLVVYVKMQYRGKSLVAETPLLSLFMVLEQHELILNAMGFF